LNRGERAYTFIYFGDVGRISMKKVLFAGIAAAALIAAPAFAQGIGGAVGSTTNGAVGGSLGNIAGGATGAVGGAAGANSGSLGANAGGALGAGGSVAGKSLGAGATTGVTGGASGSLSPNSGAAGGVAANGSANGKSATAGAGTDTAAIASADASGWKPLTGAAVAKVKVGAKVVNAHGDSIGTVSSVNAGVDGKITGVKIKTAAGAVQTASASDLLIKGNVLQSSTVSAQ
jgi:hypothetical protein